MSADDEIYPPWTQEQVDALNAYQRSGQYHPFTCGRDRGNAAHRAYADERGEDLGQLVATVNGWKCPVCDYRQEWAHDFMANPAILQRPRIGSIIRRPRLGRKP